MDATVPTTDTSGASESPPPPPPPPPTYTTASSTDTSGDSNSPPSPPTNLSSEKRHHLTNTITQADSIQILTQNPDGTFRCPFCPDRKKQNYFHNDILQHALGIGASSSHSRTPSQIASHRALASFLLDPSTPNPNPNPNNQIQNSSSSSDVTVTVTASENWHYLQLTSGKQAGELRTKNPDGTFRCPFCPDRKKRNYLHNEILQHALGIGSSCSASRTSSQIGSHRALVSFLLDLAPNPEIPNRNNAESDNAEKDDKEDEKDDDRFVYPWTGVVANIPTKAELWSSRIVGESGFRLRKQLARFSPVQVRAVWNYLGHSGFAVVEFGKDWKGFHDVMAFHRHFAASGFGKAGWLEGKLWKGSGIYGWIARASDFNSDCPLGRQLKKKGELMTVDEVSHGALRKKERLVGKLERKIVERNRRLEALKSKYSEESLLLDKLMEERKKTLDSYNLEARKLWTLASNHTRKVVEDNDKLRLQLEKKCIELDALVLENNKKRRTLEDEHALKSKAISLQKATLEQKKADENVMEAIKQQQREKEAITAKILQLEKQLEVKQQLELEIEHLKGKVQIMTHMISDSDIEIKVKIFQLNKELHEKIEVMEDLETVNQALVVKESSSRTELEQARQELVTVLSETTTTNSKIHVKMIDELNMTQELWSKGGRKATLKEALHFLIDTWKATRRH